MTSRLLAFGTGWIWRLFTEMGDPDQGPHVEGAR